MHKFATSEKSYVEKSCLFSIKVAI